MQHAETGQNNKIKRIKRKKNRKDLVCGEGRAGNEHLSKESKITYLFSSRTHTRASTHTHKVFIISVFNAMFSICLETKNSKVFFPPFSFVHLATFMSSRQPLFVHNLNLISSFCVSYFCYITLLYCHWAWKLMVTQINFDSFSLAARLPDGNKFLPF